MECRAGCGACCIAPSISTAMPDMPQGKPAGVPCSHLDDELLCRLWQQPQRPAVCSSLSPCAEMCGSHRDEAMAYLTELEQATA